MGRQVDLGEHVICLCKRHGDDGEWRPDVPLAERLAAWAVLDAARIDAIYARRLRVARRKQRVRKRLAA